MSTLPITQTGDDRRRIEYRSERYPAEPPASLDFGALLARLRVRRRGVTQSRLAELADFDHSYISRLETGARMPTRDAVNRLADALGCPEIERRELLQAAGHAAGATDPLLDELAAILADPATPEWRRQAVRGGLWTVREMARRATESEVG